MSKALSTWIPSILAGVGVLPLTMLYMAFLFLAFYTDPFSIALSWFGPILAIGGVGLACLWLSLVPNARSWPGAVRGSLALGIMLGVILLSLWNALILCRIEDFAPHDAFSGFVFSVAPLLVGIWRVIALIRANSMRNIS